jgi:ribosomal protein S18 acetylase RimI-like enzyme
MQSSDLQVRRLYSSHDAAFETLLAIYIEANAPSERKTPERLAAMIQEPGYYFLAGIEQGVVVGYSILRLLDGSDAALLEYLAVARDRRNEGIGRALLRKTANLDAFTGKFLLAEVNSDKRPTAEQAERTRRKAFYRRLRWREVDGLDYVMPPVSSALPPEMDMLVFKRELPSSIERARLGRWLELCYVEVYGQSAEDPRIKTMIGVLPERVRLI